MKNKGKDNYFNFKVFLKTSNLFEFMGDEMDSKTCTQRRKFSDIKPYCQNLFLMKSKFIVQ